MRIIDKNADYYDYWQGVYRDDSIVFDRTASFTLTKELVCEHLWNARPARRGRREYDRYSFVLLQICHCFWLFLVEDGESPEGCRPTDYSVELLSSWKDYDRPRRLIGLEIISFGYDILWRITSYTRGTGSRYDREKILGRLSTLTDAIHHGNYRVMESMNHHTVVKGDGTKSEKHIPLLKASGFAAHVDAHEAYLAFEEFFLLEKSASERTESVGLSNDEKVENHGFDLTMSFRGKMGEQGGRTHCHPQEQSGKESPVEN